MQKSVFDLTHERKLSMDMGKLVPTMCIEVLPGDEFSSKTDMLVRIAPMLAPMMHRVNVYTHYFFVPTRTLQTDWPDFITGGVDGLNATVAPTITSPAVTGYGLNTLWDYFGLPTDVPDLEVLAYPFRAYAKIYNEWFRDQNLITPVAMSLGNGADSTTNTTLLSRAWEKDYFTSALPWAQRGDPVEIPLGGSVPVTLVPHTTSTEPMIVKDSTTGAVAADGSQLEANLVGGDAAALSNANATAAYVIDPSGRYVADLGSANPITVNALRQVIMLQRWMEKNARGGARLVEVILEHFGVRSSDARLQRSEYLGGGVSPLQVSEILQTSATDTGTPLGAMAGHGFATPQEHTWKKTFEEHGYVIGITSVLPRTAYQQGVARFWNRRSRYDWAWPTFTGLGEQAILNKEIYAEAADPEDVFGYTGRYDEYRQIESTVHGDFRDTLNYWTMARIFTSEPTLSSAFVSSDPTKRILADTAGQALWVQVLNQIQAKRPLPLVARPGISGI